MGYEVNNKKRRSSITPILGRALLMVGFAFGSFHLFDWYFKKENPPEKAENFQAAFVYTQTQNDSQKMMIKGLEATLRKYFNKIYARDKELESFPSWYYVPGSADVIAKTKYDSNEEINSILNSGEYNLIFFTDEASFKRFQTTNTKKIRTFFLTYDERKTELNPYEHSLHFDSGLISLKSLLKSFNIQGDISVISDGKDSSQLNEIKRYFPKAKFFTAANFSEYKKIIHSSNEQNAVILPIIPSFKDYNKEKFEAVLINTPNLVIGYGFTQFPADIFVHTDALNIGEESGIRIFEQTTSGLKPRTINVNELIIGQSIKKFIPISDLKGVFNFMTSKGIKRFD